MTEPSKDVVVYDQPGVPVTAETANKDEWLDVKKEAASALFKVLVEGGSVWLQNERLKGQTEAEWERIQADMARVDNNTKNALQLLEAELKHSKESSSQLDKILNAVANMSDDKAKYLAPMLEKMVEGAFNMHKQGS